MTVALKGGEWSAARPGRTLPQGKTRYPFYRRLGGSQGRSGRAENLVRTRIRFRTFQPGSSVAIPTELPGPPGFIAYRKPTKMAWCKLRSVRKKCKYYDVLTLHHRVESDGSRFIPDFLEKWLVQTLSHEILTTVLDLLDLPALRPLRCFASVGLLLWCLAGAAWDQQHACFAATQIKVI